jgi:hypothetical protein
MKSDLIHTLTDTFEAHAQQAENGVEFWLARDLQYLLGYTKWDNFLNVISKAKTACEISEHQVSDHFADVGKMVDLGSGSQREVDDIKTLLERGIRPESLPAAEDVKKVERRLATEEKKSLKNPDALDS